MENPPLEEDYTRRDTLQAVLKKIRRYNIVYIYTEKGEKYAKERGFKERKAGTQARFGHEPLKGGQIATAWKKRGYIKEV